MKSWLSHILLMALSIIATALLMKQCGPVTVVDRVEVTVDTVYKEVVTYQVDTVRVVKWRNRYDTIVKVVEVPAEPTHDGFEDVYAYNEFYKDSSLQVSGNIFYTGNIRKHDQMLIVMKDELTFIPQVKTVYQTRDILKTVTSTRQPRFLVGAYATFNRFTPEQGGVMATVVDNRFRQYTLGKDIIDKRVWMAQAQLPLFYTKPKPK